MINLFSNTGQQLSEIFERFQNERTPFYLIVVVCVFTISNAIRYNISEQKWWWIFGLIGAVLIMALLLSYSKQAKSNLRYNIQLRWTRSIGVASAVLCIFLTGQYALDDQELFLVVYIPCFIQIVVFGLYIVLKDLKPINEEIIESKDDNNVFGPNYLQLCIITTALLAGIATNASLSKKEKIESSISDLCLTDNIKEIFENSKQQSRNRKTELSDIKACYEQLKVMNTSLEAKSENMRVLFNIETYDQLLEVQQIVSKVSESPLLEAAFDCLDKNNMLDSLEEELSGSRSLIDLLLNSDAYSRQFNKLTQGYYQALNTLSEINQNTMILRSCLTPATDTVITNFIEIYENQQEIVAELNQCYYYVRKFDESTPYYLQRRYTIVIYFLLGLWVSCIIYWVTSLFEKNK